MSISIEVLVRDFKVDLDKFDDVPKLPEFQGDLKTVGKGAVVDFETTDINEKEYGAKEAVEIGAVKFAFDKNTYEFLGVISTLSQLNEPSDANKMTETIKQVTGLSFEDVKDHSFDVEEIKNFFEDCDMVYAHNSKFDKPLLDQFVVKQPFACSLNDIDWRNQGFISRKQDILALQSGFKYSAHRASSDCEANLALLVKTENFTQFVKDSFKKKGYLKIQGFTDPYGESQVRETIKKADNEFGAKFSFYGKDKFWHTSIMTEDKSEVIKDAILQKMKDLYHEKTQEERNGRPVFQYPTLSFVEAYEPPKNKN